MKGKMRNEEFWYDFLRLLLPLGVASRQHQYSIGDEYVVFARIVESFFIGICRGFKPSVASLNFVTVYLCGCYVKSR